MTSSRPTSFEIRDELSVMRISDSDSPVPPKRLGNNRGGSNKINSLSETQVFEVLTTENPSIVSDDGLRRTVGRKKSPFKIVPHCLGGNLTNRAERRKQSQEWRYYPSSSAQADPQNQ
jgi:hypothetical protein